MTIHSVTSLHPLCKQYGMDKNKPLVVDWIGYRDPGSVAIDCWNESRCCLMEKLHLALEHDNFQ